ncbi:hypothetical protein CAOG_01894 [Capsaspora owczarzaki ATCC 30864]|uniref:Peroxisomal membrane protein PEX16 n=1 Tax=Capsaspora owczarzaki (strain ATCC 30864) TaxID=595528 RepID=A0A0D2X1D3_CAPO3|nr:hypothetical protein CAOG_01894 [Capsaspora owczarzaki ATCC 30864]KJE90609.1 hypothetical protein, variant 3 [Capsaspora owczarzaki ATCC 30864]|eukprot:XP_004364762.1 hypothetical protein CAOG_01894 [Capsaspora owczarzaki ATCC 30864]
MVGSARLQAVGIALAKLKAQYEDFFLQNAAAVQQAESLLRSLSYFVPAKFKSADELGELLYALVSLLGLHNDAILRRRLVSSPEFYASQKVLRRSAAYERIATWLGVVKQVETFVELAARRTGGAKLRWTVIWVIELAKFILRAALLFRSKCDSGLLVNPPLPPIQREKATALLAKLQEQQSDSDVQESDASPPASVFSTPKREIAPPSVDSILFNARSMHERRQQQPGNLASEEARERLQQNLVPVPGAPYGTTPRFQRRLTRPPSHAEELRTPLSRRQMQGELLHMARPLVFLLVARFAGHKSWSAWGSALATDIASKILSGDSRDMHEEERGELSRRSGLLVYYLMRSPIYDRFTRSIVISAVNKLGRLFPLLGGLTAESVTDYLELWQDTYFDIWES